MLNGGSTVVNSISNGSFETPAQAVGTFRYGATGSLWQFGGAAGVSANRSGFTARNPVAPYGSQVAFLQNNGTMTQSVYLDVGTYSVSFVAAQRGSCQARCQTISVLIDGAQVGVATPASTQYREYQTLNFQITTAGMHSLRLAGLNPLGGDNTALVDNVVVLAAANSISDGSFEAPGLAAATFQYTPNGSPWQFAGGAVAANGSGFAAANPAAPDGTQAAILQCAASISQSVYLDAGTYAISFQAAQRGGSCQAHYQTIAVLVDGVQVGSYTPAGRQYSAYQTSSFPVPTTGMHTIRFAGLNPLGGDNTALLDNIAIAEMNPVSNGSFETPALTAKTFQYGATGSLWSFAGAAGVSSNGSTFSYANPSAPNGAQVAFLQNTGSMTQSVYLDAGSYAVSFQAAQRGASQTHPQVVAVLVDGVQIGLATPTGTQYGYYLTSNFQVTAGMHTLRFAALNPQGGDNTALIDNVSISASANSISDGSFEVPGLTAGTFKTGLDGSPWQFAGTAGVSSNSSAFTTANPAAPNGTQVAFLQGTGSMTQSVYLDAGSYALSFQAAQRGISQESSQQLAILVDGVQVGTIIPSSTLYGSYQSPNFPIATAGMHTIQFAGLNPDGGDNTSFVDSIAIAKASPISNGSFEVPSLVAGTYQFQPTDSLWQYAGAAGVSSNGSSLTSANPTAPNGTQVAFLQGTGSVSQSVYLSAGTFSVSFQAAQRVSQTYAQVLQVLVDGAQVALITPSTTQYVSYQTPTFTVGAGMHTIAFLGLDPQAANSIAFLDRIQI
jgi:hypothetical protein